MLLFMWPLTSWVMLAEQLQVLGSVVRLDAVPMMNQFVRAKCTAQLVGHHQPMLCYIPARLSLDEYIAIPDGASTTPAGIIRECIGALLGAESLPVSPFERLATELTHQCEATVPPRPNTLRIGTTTFQAPPAQLATPHCRRTNATLHAQRAVRQRADHVLCSPVAFPRPPACSLYGVPFKGSLGVTPSRTGRAFTDIAGFTLHIAMQRRYS